MSPRVDEALSGERMMRQLDALSRCSEDSEMLTRTFLTDAHKAAAMLLKRAMEDAGMCADFDAVGNVVGRYEGNAPDLPAVLIGSHYDTVRNAGRYDGMYGIIAGIACVEALHLSGERLPFAIEVIGFADEEGVRFGATLLGSRAIAGTFDTGLLSKCDANGTNMADAMRGYGLDPDAILQAARSPGSVLAFVETHIEQGPVLEHEALPVGVVTAIAGATRFEIEVSGLAGHAGTVPMRLRRDAGAAVAEAVLAVETRCREVEGLVGTVGQMAIPTGATNVIPGHATFSVDIRSGDDDVREAAVHDLMATFDAISKRRDVNFEVRKTHEACAATCAPWLMSQLEAAIARRGVEPRFLLSGAGHDAMAFPPLTSIAMLFVRCGNGGISHHPDETMTAHDAAFGAAVLLDFLRNFVPPRRQ